jgi:hypothetical protein
LKFKAESGNVKPKIKSDRSKKVKDEDDHEDKDEEDDEEGEEEGEEAMSE